MVEKYQASHAGAAWWATSTPVPTFPSQQVQGKM